MNQQQRFNYYIKNWKDKETIKIPDNAKNFKQNELIYYTGPNTPAPQDFPFHYGCWNEMFWWHQDNLPLNIPCLSISADGIDNQELPAIVKVRYINNPKGGIIAPLEYCRHWHNYYHKPKDCFFNNKNNILFWRGTTTGKITNSGNRFILVTKYFNKNSKIDVGFSNICQGNSEYNKYVKGEVDISEFLKYKYILSIEGNDKDSGLNWKLASNSLVLMAKPKIESWLMEGLLKPYVHYVPLKDDYSDLDQIIEWCQNNDEECQKIVKNANQFMKQFEDIEVEKNIFRMIKDYYQKQFTFV